MNSLPHFEYKKQVYSNENKMIKQLEKINVSKAWNLLIKRLLIEGSPYIWFLFTALVLGKIIIYVFNSIK